MEHLEERPINPFTYQSIVDEFIEDLVEPIYSSLMEQVVEYEDIHFAYTIMDDLGSHFFFELTAGLFSVAISIWWLLYGFF